MIFKKLDCSQMGQMEDSFVYDHRNDHDVTTVKWRIRSTNLHMEKKLTIAKTLANKLKVAQRAMERIILGTTLRDRMKIE